MVDTNFLEMKLKEDERIVKISKELASLWQNVSLQRIQAKLENVLKSYDKCAKRGKYGVLDDLFNITKLDGEWLSMEDKILYLL